MDVRDLWNQLTVASLGLTRAWQPATSSAASACARIMRERGFDAAPVIDEADGNLYVVEIRQLRSMPSRTTVSDAMRRVDSQQVVTPATPLSAVTSLLQQHDTVFARDSLGGVGVISLADLARPPFAASMFASITQLEQRLNELLQLFDEVDVLAERALSKQAVARIHKLVAERQRRRMDLSFVQSLTLEDRLDVVMAYAPIWAQLAPSKAAMARLRKPCQQIRDTLAHGGTVLDINSDVRSTLRMFAEIEKLSARALELVDERIWTQFAFAEVHLDSGECLAGPSAAPHLRWQSLWVITANNPDGKSQSDEENQARQDQLLDTLHSSGIKFQTGRGGRNSHWEASAIVRTTREAALEFGQHFGQLGVFELTPDSQDVIRCCDGATVRSVPRVRPDKVR